MKITKAIEIQTESPYRGVTILSPEFQEASKLGIEALKRLQVLRAPGPKEEYRLLPGEDPE